MEKENSFMLMERSIMENGRWERDMGKGKILGQMGKCMMGIGMKIFNKE